MRAGWRSFRFTTCLRICLSNCVCGAAVIVTVHNAQCCPFARDFTFCKEPWVHCGPTLPAWRRSKGVGGRKRIWPLFQAAPPFRGSKIHAILKACRQPPVTPKRGGLFGQKHASYISFEVCNDVFGR